MKISTLLASLLLMFACTAAAQESRIISGGILNGKAISLPKPPYPDAARAAHVGGAVAVEVVLNEEGSVISAVADLNYAGEKRDEQGEKLAPEPADPYLREAAEKAAMEARFSPTLLSGVPVKVKGKIVYNFIADASDQPARVGEVYGRLLNAETVSMPMPVYPAAARAVKAGGSVTVAVEFDAEGNVTEARTTSGHPLLRAAAEQAALKAKLRPSTTGTSDKGVLVYNFVP
jgi:TonB family protein